MDNFDFKPPYESSSSDKYAFISLYLFILIFFVILSSLTLHNKIDHNLSGFPGKFNKDSEKFKIEKAESNFESSSKYYSSKLSTFLPAEVGTIKETVNDNNYIKFSLDEVFDEDAISASFKNAIMKKIEYMSELPNSSVLVFKLSIQNEKALFIKAAILAEYIAGLKNITTRFEIEHSDFEDIVQMKIMD